MFIDKSQVSPAVQAKLDALDGHVKRGKWNDARQLSNQVIRLAQFGTAYDRRQVPLLLLNHFGYSFMNAAYRLPLSDEKELATLSWSKDPRIALEAHRLWVVNACFRDLAQGIRPSPVKSMAALDQECRRLRPGRTESEVANDESRNRIYGALSLRGADRSIFTRIRPGAWLETAIDRLSATGDKDDALRLVIAQVTLERLSR